LMLRRRSRHGLVACLSDFERLAGSPVQGARVSVDSLSTGADTGRPRMDFQREGQHRMMRTRAPMGSARERAGIDHRAHRRHDARQSGTLPRRWNGFLPDETPRRRCPRRCNRQSARHRDF
jgi:hypothetical protein